MIVLGTSSSESVLPRMMAKIENLGCEESVVGLVIPTGYSFNLDGTCIYLTMATLFLAQATNTPLTHRRSRSAFSRAAADLEGRGRRHRQRLYRARRDACRRVGTIPVASIALILGVDRFMSEARALTNLVGNGVATVVVAKWETRSTCRGCNGTSPARATLKQTHPKRPWPDANWRQAGSIGGTAFGPAKYSQCTVPGGQCREAASAALIMPAGPQ